MRRFFIAFLIIAALAAGGGLIANTAYQAGLATAVTTVAATAPDGSVVIPVAPGGYPLYGYGYGPGWGGGFSILGFLGTLLVIILIIGLIRAIAFRGSRGHGGWGHHGWGPGGRGDQGEAGERPWERQARSTFDTWHRQAHDDATPERAS